MMAYYTIGAALLTELATSIIARRVTGSWFPYLVAKKAAACTSKVIKALCRFFKNCRLFTFWTSRHGVWFRNIAMSSYKLAVACCFTGLTIKIFAYIPLIIARFWYKLLTGPALTYCSRQCLFPIIL